jgi:hypothetical protein
VCEALDWRKSDGALKDMSCRVALLRRHREGLIELAPPLHQVNPCHSFGRRPAQAELSAVLEENFVEAARFQGTCYRAANWRGVGETEGRGKLGDHRLGQGSTKQVWVYPLAKDFREPLCR